MKNTGKEKYFTTKKLIALLLILAVIFGALAVIIHFTTKVTNESYEKCAIGDINGDGYINSGDALDAMRKITGAVELFENQETNGDVNLDGRLDSADALILLKYCTGEIKSVPYTGYAEALESQKDGKSIIFEGDNIFISAKILNEWKNTDGTTSYQISVTAKNSSSEEISDWTAKLYLSDSVKLSKKWDCSVDVSEKVLEISGEEIPTASAAACGLIVISKDNLSINNIEMG